MEWEKDEMWPEEMWQVWESEGFGNVDIDGEPYEYGLVSEKESEIEVPTIWLRPAGKHSPTVYSDIKRDDPLYVNGTDQFRAMVETVRMVHNILQAKDAGVLAKMGNV